MDEDAADKLVGLERHSFVAVVLFSPVVLPFKGDAVLIEGDEPGVGDGDAMGVAGEIFEYCAGSGKWRSGVDIPLAVAKASDEAFEGAGVLKRLELAKEAQALLAVECEEFIEEPASEQGGEHFDVDEEAGARANPAMAVEGETAAGDDASWQSPRYGARR